MNLEAVHTGKRQTARWMLLVCSVERQSRYSEEPLIFRKAVQVLWEMKRRCASSG